MVRCDIYCSGRYRVPARAWQRLADTIGRRHRLRQSSVSVAVVGRQAMQTLNHRYRGSQRPTDVLSFAERDVRSKSAVNQASLGEIVICYPVAVAQAKRYGHPVEQELLLLFVHGLLHLLGFDHDTAKKAQKMKELENKVLPRSVSRTTSC